MRESFGGAFMIKLALIFVIIYVTFMSIALVYAKTFRAKNGVINVIEQTQFDGTNYDAIDDYLKSVGYIVSIDALQDKCTNGTLTQRGVCIVPKGNDNSRYYQVIAYIKIDFPFFNLHMVLPVSGETKSFVDWREIP